MPNPTFTQIELAEELAECLRELIANDDGREASRAHRVLERWDTEMERAWGDGETTHNGR
jgi:hypothetical protein